MNIAKYSAYVLFISAALFFGGMHTVAQAPAKASVVAEPEEVPLPEPVVKKSTELHKEMRPICGCESGGGPNHPPRQFEADGITVRLGRVNSNDVGACQINTEPRNGHVFMAPKLGFDLWTTEGNIAYANWLYEQEGTTPWNSSKACWGKN